MTEYEVCVITQPLQIILLMLMQLAHKKGCAAVIMYVDV